MVTEPRSSAASRLLRSVGVSAGALAAAVGLFLLLPVLQAISETPPHDLMVMEVDTANVPPPPPPPLEEEPPPEESEPEPAPPDLTADAAPLDLSQLELALDPGLGAGAMEGDFAVKLQGVTSAAKVTGDGDEVDALFSLSDLDQKPRVIYQPSPTLTAEVRKKAPGTVYVLFVVDASGKVQDPVVQSSTDPVFEPSALAAVKQWKFEPGKRSGQAVRFRMRVPISFPKGG